MCYLCEDNLNQYEINYSGKWHITRNSGDCLQLSGLPVNGYKRQAAKMFRNA